MFAFFKQRKYQHWHDKSIYLIGFSILLLIVGGRLINSNFDFSYFIVAGSDFTNSSLTPLPIIVQSGQGYDGQFFFRYALDPFDFTKNSYGINVDLPPYRLQRITYPFLVWLLSFGGLPALVPFNMVFINILFFSGILFFTRRIINLTGGLITAHYVPLLLCGLYMSLARDLSEIAEMFMFLAAIYFLYKKSFLFFAVYASLCLLTRETSIIALAPLSVYSLYSIFRSRIKFADVLLLIAPFVIMISWKIFIHSTIEPANYIQAGQNIGIPFLGLIRGFRYNLDISSTKNILQLIFWILYMTWQLWFIKLIVHTIFNTKNTDGEILRPLVIVYFTWLLFACCLSAAIYVDDWSFVRVFSLWNMIGFLILIIKRESIGNWFKIFSVIMVFLTVARLIIRV